MSIDIEGLKKISAPEGFAAIDRVFAEFLLRRIGRDDAPALEAAALFVSRAVRLGHSACDLGALAGRAFAADDALPREAIALPAWEAWREELLDEANAAVLSELQPGVFPQTPLVLDGSLLYLQRYWGYEQTVAQEICRRMKRPMQIPEFPPGRMAALIDYFKRREEREAVDFQQLAAFTMAALPFGIVTGGPGTGKTTVVAAMLALELERNPHLQIALCAPTGKAQARMQESLLAGIRKLSTSEAVAARLQLLPCSTIHRLLKPIPGTTRFHYGAENPLPTDLLIVDECSMISLALMAKLLPALKPTARVVFLGDRFQLASVDAGAVLADLCECADPNTLAPAAAEAFRRQTGWEVPHASGATPLSGAVVELQENHRFASAPTIGRVSRAIRDADDSQCDALAREISQLAERDFRTRAIPPARIEAALQEWLTRPVTEEGLCYADLKTLARRGGAENLQTAFALLHRAQILCATRHGALGVQRVNDFLRHHLRLRQEDTPGRPVIITRNDPVSGLFNGDIGLLWRDLAPNAPKGSVRVYFENNPRGYFLAELPEHDTVFAMTVHKSQGSGFTHVLLMLPDKDQNLLSRELLYTGITRAERSVELWTDETRLRQALSRRTLRQSALSKRIREFVTADHAFSD